MTKLIIRLGDQVDTIEADTRTKLIAAIKAGLPAIAPETVTVLIDADVSLTNQAQNTVGVDAMWGEVRDNALRKASRMLELGSSMGSGQRGHDPPAHQSGTPGREEDCARP